MKVRSKAAVDNVRAPARTPTAEECYRDPMGRDIFLQVVAEAGDFDDFLARRDAFYQRYETSDVSPLESPAEQAEVAVFDSFAVLDQKFEHGEQVTWLIQQETGLADREVVAIPNEPITPLPLLLAEGNISAEARLDRFIEVAQSDTLRFTTLKLKQLLKEGAAPQLKVINQSQGLSALDLVGELAESIVDKDKGGLSEVGGAIYQGLGLEPEFVAENFIQVLGKLTQRVLEVQRNSKAVGRAKEEHTEVSRRLAEKGVHYVVPVGNDGELRAFLESQGVTVDQEADDNQLINRHNIAVAAFDSKGTPDPADDELAGFNSNMPEVAFLADGVEVTVGEGELQQKVTGSSFAAPKASSRLFVMRELEPDLPGQAAVSLLQQLEPPSIPGSPISTLR